MGGGRERGGGGGLEREHHVAMETASDAAEHTDGFSPSNPTLSHSLPPSLQPSSVVSRPLSAQGKLSPVQFLKSGTGVHSFLSECSQNLRRKHCRIIDAGFGSQQRVQSVAFIARTCTNNLIPHVTHVTKAQ